MNNDPIEEARKTKRQLIADEMLEGERVKARSERMEAEAKAKKALVDVETAGDKQERGGFQVKGSVNLGEFDIQAQVREANAEAKRLKDQMEDQLAREGQVNDQLKEALHKKELEIVELGLNAQIKTLADMIQKGTNQRGFLEQYNELMTMAKTLGLANPQAGSNAMVSIELEKLKFDQTLELRRLDAEAQERERKYQMDLRRMDDERAWKKEEFKRQEQRDQMLPKGLNVIGQAIAQGLMTGNPGQAVSGTVEEQPIESASKAYHVEANPNEAGSFDCPKCGTQVGLGPTSTVAVCAKCGTRVEIKRTAPSTRTEELPAERFDIDAPFTPDPLDVDDRSR